MWKYLSKKEKKTLLILPLFQLQNYQMSFDGKLYWKLSINSYDIHGIIIDTVYPQLIELSHIYMFLAYQKPIVRR
jgi:hypothetical protein